VSSKPESEPTGDARVVAEAVEALLANFLPDEVRGSFDGNLPTPFGQAELTPLQCRALQQADVDAGQVAAQILKVEVDQLRRELERLERTLTRQDDKNISEARVIVLVFLVLSALVAAVTLLGFATGKF
jgi:hypothetical protein